MTKNKALSSTSNFFLAFKGICQLAKTKHELECRPLAACRPPFTCDSRDRTTGSILKSGRLVPLRDGGLFLISCESCCEHNGRRHCEGSWDFGETSVVTNLNILTTDRPNVRSPTITWALIPTEIANP